MKADIRLVVYSTAGIYPRRSFIFLGGAELSMTSERFAYIWRYTIEPTCRSAFLAAYEPSGEWAQLFSRDPSYIQTVLLQDDGNENRYVTIDYWNSKAARDSFRERCSVEFDSLDSRCEAFTREEKFLGDHLEIGEFSS